MKRTILILTILCVATTIHAQNNFTSQATTARTSYQAGKLEDAHFALEQMMMELDMIIGKEVLKLLPASMQSLQMNSKDDNVTGNVGFVGATIRRTYGTSTKMGDLSIISNSPMVASLNAMMSSPLMAMSSDPRSKVVKIQGYKARLNKDDDANSSYSLQIPLSNALITYNLSNTNENEMMAMANSIPLEKVAKLVQ